MKNKIRGRKKAGESEARAESVLVDEELVMVPAETGAGGPFAEANLVLDERGLFEIPGVVFWKGEIEGTERIELRGIGDVVAERFVEVSGVDFSAGFPFLAAAMNRDRRFDVGFAEATILKSDDGSGKRVGVESLRIIADHGAKIGEDVGGKSVLVGGEAEGFENGAILALRGGLLNEFVGDFEARKAVAEQKADAVLVREIALVTNGVIGVGAGVGEILEDGRVEVAVCGGAVYGNSEEVFIPGILSKEIAIGSGKAAAGSDEFAVEALAIVAGGFDFDDATQFAAVLGGKAGGVNGEGLHVVAFDFYAKAGGAVVGERNAVDDELSLILGTAGVEDGTAFEEPAGLGINKVDERAAG